MTVRKLDIPELSLKPNSGLPTCISSAPAHDQFSTLSKSPLYQSLHTGSLPDELTKFSEDVLKFKIVEEVCATVLAIIALNVRIAGNVRHPPLGIRLEAQIKILMVKIELNPVYPRTSWTTIRLMDFQHSMRYRCVTEVV